MTKNPMNFMTNQFTRWFNLNSEGEDIERVIVVPCSSEDKDYGKLVAEGGEFFESCEWGTDFKKDDYYIFQLTSKGKEFFLYWNKGLDLNDGVEEDIGLATDKCHFLASLVFYTKFNITPSKNLKLIESEGYVFEEELLQILPELLTLSLSEEFENEKIEVKIIRVLLYVELLDKKLQDMHERILELALSLPEKDHDWLYYELMRAIRSKKKDSMFLCLYKMLEFFFPLNYVFNLSGRLAFSGSALQLLEHCRNELNWNINHNFGLRGTKDYASHAFCSYLGVDVSHIDVMPEGEAKKRKIESCKSDGLEKLSKLRHALTHQNFKEYEIGEEEISKHISAITNFLIEAFAEYNRKIGV